MLQPSAAAVDGFRSLDVSRVLHDDLMDHTLDHMDVKLRGYYHPDSQCGQRQLQARCQDVSLSSVGHERSQSVRSRFALSFFFTRDATLCSMLACTVFAVGVRRMVIWQQLCLESMENDPGFRWPVFCVAC